MALGGATADLVVRIVTDTKDASKGIDAASSKVSKFRSGLSTAATGATAVLGGLTVAAVAFGKAAAEDEQSQTLLANAMKNGAGASKDQIANMEDWISKAAMASGVADDELRPAMSALVRATGDATKAQRDMKTAMDISAATGKPLETVTKAIAKGYGGSTTALGRLVPGISEATQKSGDMARIMAEAGKQTKGAMAESADTAAGRMARMTVAMDEAKESLGAALLPLMAKFATVMARVGAFIQKHSTTFQILAVVIGTIAVAIIALNAALTVQDAILALSEIQWLATWAAAAAPVVLVVAAIAAVIAIFVLLYKKVKWFRDFVNAVWAGIKTGARAVAAVFKAVWDTAIKVVKAYFTAYKTAVLAVFSAIKTAVRAAVEVFKSVWRGARDSAKEIFRAIRDAFSAIWKGLGKLVSDAFDAVKTAITNAKTWIDDKWSALTDILTAPFDAVVDVIGDILGAINDVIERIKDIKLPSVGGIVDKITPWSAAPVPSAPSTRGVGAVVPMARGVRTSAAGGVTINVNGAIDPENTARQIKRILAGHDRRVGLRTA